MCSADDPHKRMYLVHNLHLKHPNNLSYILHPTSSRDASRMSTVDNVSSPVPHQQPPCDMLPSSEALNRRQIISSRRRSGQWLLEFVDHDQSIDWLTWNEGVCWFSVVLVYVNHNSRTYEKWCATARKKRFCPIHWLICDSNQDLRQSRCIHLVQYYQR